MIVDSFTCMELSSIFCSQIMIAFFSFPFFYGLFLFHFFLTSMTFLGLQLDVELLAIKQSPFGYVMGSEKHIGMLICFLSIVFQYSFTLLCRTGVKIIEG